MTPELVTIVMPVYNSAKTISETLKSIIEQEYNNLEIIIIDDGSTDDTVTIVKSFSDSRIKLFQRAHYGPGAQRNFGLKKASGKYIAFCDSDDLSEKNRIMRQIEYLLINKDVDIVGSHAFFINERGQKIGDYDVPVDDINYYFPVFCPIITSTIVFRKKIINMVGIFNEVLEPGTDYEWLLKAHNRGIIIKNTIDKFVKVRRSRISFTSNNRHFLKKKMFAITNTEIERLYKNLNKDYDYFFRKGLIYYYYSNVYSSIKYFYKSVKIDPTKLLINLRYILPCLLGNKLLSLVRHLNISFLVNKYIKLFGINIAYKR